MIKNYIIVLLLLVSIRTNAQVGINTTNPHNSSILDVFSTDKGFLAPRLTTVQRDAIALPSEGLLIFNTDIQCIEIFNNVDVSWKSICGEDIKNTASFVTNCNSIAVQGDYFTGIELSTSLNTITVEVEVTSLGHYFISTNSLGMVFLAEGDFTNIGTQTVTLQGYGFPQKDGLNFATLVIGSEVCSAIINVQNGLANVTSCGILGSISGNIIANTPIILGEVSIPISGINYSNGTVYGFTTQSVNGISISEPLQGSFTTPTPTGLDLLISGTPILPGNTVINYGINDQTGCSITIPVKSGTGLASLINCSGSLGGTYQVSDPMNISNVKNISLNVTTLGTFNLRSDTQNGVYFAVSYNATVTGNNNVVLIAYGIPLSTGVFNYTLFVNTTVTTFVSCTFSVNFSNPSSFPNFIAPQCEAVGSNYSYIKASNTNANDGFGGVYFSTINTNVSYNVSNYRYGNNEASKISSDGLTMVVGAPWEDSTIAGGPTNNAGTNFGAAYVYSRSSLTSAFVFQAMIKGTNSGTNDYFGNSVDISDDGNTIIVGASLEDGSGTGVNPAENNLATNSGAAYVFTRTGSAWSQLAYLKANNTGANDSFGFGVSVSGDGNYFAVGANYEAGSGFGINPINNNTANGAGAVYTYSRSGSTIVFDSYIKAHNAQSLDFFGTSLALNYDGTYLIVGAPGEDGSGYNSNPSSNNNASYSGAAYLFNRASSWSQLSYIKPSNTKANQWFGFSVDISSNGSKMVVGAPFEDGTFVADTGATDSGAAYIYNLSGSTITFNKRLKADNFGASDNFGKCVAISSDASSIAVGAPFEDTSLVCPTFSPNNLLVNSGAAYLYRDLTGNFIQSGFLKMRTETTAALGATANDSFGLNVSLTSDGKAVLCGVADEDGSGLNVNSIINNTMSNAGAAILFSTN